VVVVQPSTYGLDNRCTLEAVAALGDGARAVVVIDDSVGEDELTRLTLAGARGARFHMLPGGAVSWAALRPVADRIAGFGWHIQLQLNGRDLAEHEHVLDTLPVPLVVDHVGRFMPPVEVTDPEFGVLRRLVDNGRTWVKLSAPYESRPDATHRYVDVTRTIEALVRQAPERMLWASNWPHPGQSDPPTVDDLLRLAAQWLPDERLREQVLVHNPAAVYGF
jgi:D-galactarolactone isomerase